MFQFTLDDGMNNDSPRNLYASFHDANSHLMVESFSPLLVNDRESAQNQSSYHDYCEEDLKYPSLLEGSKMVADPEWAQILYDSAYGRLPAGFSIRNDGISYAIGGKRQAIMPSVNPEEAINEIIAFFRTAGSVKTAIDRENERRTLIEARKQQRAKYHAQSWSKLKTTEQNEAADQYIRVKSDQMKLKSKQRAELKTVINIGIGTGAINDSDIIFADGRIQEITAIEYKNGRFRLTKTAASRVTLTTIKDTYSDEEYFTIYGKSTLTDRHFSGFPREWDKINNNIVKFLTGNKSQASKARFASSPVVLSTNSSRGTPSLSATGHDLQMTLSLDSIDDSAKFASVATWNQDEINRLIPTKYPSHSSNPLLNPIA